MQRTIPANFVVSVTARESITTTEDVLAKKLQIVAIPSKVIKINNKNAETVIRNALVEAYGQRRYNIKDKLKVRK